MFRFTTMFCVASLAALVVSQARAEERNTLSAQQKADGWQQLFDGESLDGWAIKSGFATYRVENGAIVGKTADSSPNSFLVSAEKFGDFDLRFQVLLHDNELNSGVQVRSTLKGEEHGGRTNGPQAEIEASPGQSGFIYGEALGTGWLSPEPDSKDKSVNQHSYFKNQQWNDYRILAQGDRIQTWINGNQVADLKVPAEVMKTHAEGMIGLQVHGVGKRGPFQVRWRDIYIKKLSGAE